MAVVLQGVEQIGQAPPRKIRLRCPGCRHIVTLDWVGANDLTFQSETIGSFFAGQRICPNPECHAHLFVVCDGSSQVFASYPAERVDFDATNVPEQVVSAIEEAITSHAEGCYVASAMMVRKTLEEVCRDRGAKGENLKERIAALGNKVVLPESLLAGLDDLRLLGNDAAHVKSRDYEQVGQEEVEVALDITKEILKATYQLDSIVDRLKSLKRAGRPAPTEP